MEKKQPLLSFEFANSNGKIRPFTFKEPLKVIAAYKINEVLPCFQLVQEAVEQGYYAAGFLSYESAPAFDPAFRVKDCTEMPLLWFGIFSEPVEGPLVSNGVYQVSEWNPSVDMDEYNRAISSIKQAIECGDTYQTNYTIRLHSQFQGDDIAFFETLKRAQSSNYCAYINTGDQSILSASPELFFRVEGNKITTRPMKGTIQRGTSFAEDEANAEWLYHSEKNRAENLMIVDLLRNDLGMIAEPGTVTVPKLFEIEQYPTVHQMTSTITAKISAKVNLVEIFKALFPCGSITGAPKISTMSIITDLESAPREVYCGAIGYITPEKEAVFNVPIRTVMINHQSGRATYGVGGGITWDSTTAGEYEEVLAKAKLLRENRPEFQLLESFLLDNGEYFLLEEHLARLNKSAHYFGFKVSIENVKKSLLEFSSQHSTGMFKVRLLTARAGKIVIEGAEISPMNAPLKVILADKPLDQNNPFLYHKTTNREVYSQFQNKKPADVFDVLLWNEDGELTEFTNGNVVLEIDGKFWTPPVSNGLLAGTFREMLLINGDIQEKTLTVQDLQTCTKIWFINSVRKWVEVELVN
ncbi:aminodeoxychorismate synthase component I [Neobacillus mesonae]|uniref:Aminodeoxychorismate synthase, component I n=1 Tax=Neobacillus mesonae TaxID=1193713 RepID=A0A3Q9QX01_9BACI|nr:aminodeoxychorismate synthase component I [Neobacillus mesonae]AZU62237.1 aminodeoxychorismate synthase, component I [Neobacillus mesonae]